MNFPWILFSLRVYCDLPEGYYTSSVLIRRRHPVCRTAAYLSSFPTSIVDVVDGKKTPPAGCFLALLKQQKKKKKGFMMKTHLILWGSLALATSSLTHGSDALTKQEPTVAKAAASNRFAHAATPEGQTLPKNVLRGRIVDKTIFGGDIFTEEGQRQKIGLSTNVHVNGFVLEYGLTDRLSLQALVPVYANNQASMNLGQFSQSEKYANAYRDVYGRTHAGVTKNWKQLRPMCMSEEDCAKRLASGGNLPVGFPLSTGEHGSSEDSLHAHAHKTVMRNAMPVPGNTGIGDMEVGALYNFLRTDSVLFSTGLGLRTPTGSYGDAPIRRTTGAGLYDAGLQLNAAYSPLFGLWLSAQSRHEMALNSRTQGRGSLLDPTRLNEAQPLDGSSNEQKYEKRGFETKSFLKANYGWGALTSALKPIATNVSYQYNRGRGEYLDGVNSKAVSVVHGVGYGISASGLGYGLPLAVDVDYFTPVAGKNAIANNELTATLNLYAKF
jgi:hypothetical protein